MDLISSRVLISWRLICKTPARFTRQLSDYSRARIGEQAGRRQTMGYRLALGDLMLLASWRLIRKPPAHYTPGLMPTFPNTLPVGYLRAPMGEQAGWRQTMG